MHTLQALQANKDILINTMDVFVQEPLLDWEKLARRLATQQTTSGDSNPSSWFPQNKIDIAKRKLNKLNPAHIMWNELVTSVHRVRQIQPNPKPNLQNKPYLKHLQAVVMGDPNHNIRAQVKEKCQSARQQVDCLVDMATDPNILGRSWGTC